MKTKRILSAVIALALCCLAVFPAAADVVGPFDPVRGGWGFFLILGLVLLAVCVGVFLIIFFAVRKKKAAKKPDEQKPE